MSDPSIASRAEAYLLVNPVYAETVRGRLVKNSEDAGGCRIWRRQTISNGYGRIKIMGFGSKPLAHRVAYILAKGPIPEGLQLDHLCRVRACINPDHLEPVTQVENMARGVVWNYWRDRDACKWGHPLVAENVYLYRGARHCRTCRANTDRRRVMKAASVTIPVTAS